MNSSNSAERTSPASPLTIAFADDVPEIQALAAGWLSAAGHQVLCAANGAELLDIVRHRPVDVVITDVMMPENDGFEVIRALKQSAPEVKIITISGGASVMPTNDCLRVAKALGAHAVVPKPLTRSRLLAALQDVRAA